MKPWAFDIFDPDNLPLIINLLVVGLLIVGFVVGTLREWFGGK